MEVMISIVLCVLAFVILIVLLKIINKYLFKDKIKLNFLEVFIAWTVVFIINIISNFFNIFGIPINISTAFITGLLELTNGVFLSANLYKDYYLISILLTSFLLGFAGISVLFQVYSIISKENISIKPYIIGKLLQGFISTILTFILL